MKSLLTTMVVMIPLSSCHLHPHARTKRSEEAAEEVKAHISEELEEFSSVDVENMTEEERDYHYFRLHDFDKNNLLDGLEVFKALAHEHENETISEDSDDDLKSGGRFDDIVEMIDRVLEEDDTNKDGFLSYSEFAAGRRRASAESVREPEL